MRPLAIVALAALGAAAICFADATAFGQRYVPLRYDLRLPPLRHRPGPVGYGYQPLARLDPYSFEAVQLRNYFVTGNVRAGKVRVTESWCGTVAFAVKGQLCLRVSTIDSPGSTIDGQSGCGSTTIPGREVTS